MFSKPALFATVLCCCVLQPSGFTQQFRSGHLITIAPAPSSPVLGQAFGVGDFNGDGRPDFLIQTEDSTGAPVAAVMLQNSNGTFTERTTTVPVHSSTIPIHATVIADLNGDGKPDILTA